MDEDDFLAAEQIKLRIKFIDKYIAKLALNKVTAALLLEIYSVLGDPTDYDVYIESLVTALNDKKTALIADFAAIS